MLVMLVYAYYGAASGRGNVEITAPKRQHALRL